MERSVLNTKPTFDLVQKHNVVTLRADWTKPNRAVEDALKRFDSISIPLTVIYRAGSTDDPIILRDVYSRATLLEKLEEAAASRSKSPGGNQASTN
ncbi:MAG: hypothetical protein ACE5KM_06010 [Planctomycetaceae bacterium]